MKGPALGLAKKVSNILLSVMDWFLYLISEKSFMYASNSSFPDCNKIFTSSRQMFSCIIINK